MTISLYQASTPIFVRMLGNLKNILAKGEAYAAAKKFDGAVLVNSRLAPDMFALAKQVQIASDMAKGCVARLGGVEPPKFEDNETTLGELMARVDKTIAFIQTVKAEQMEGSETRSITLKFPNAEYHFTGLDYLQNYAMPNVYFHIATAYNILRHNGVGLGKKDYLGGA